MTALQAVPDGPDPDDPEMARARARNLLAQAKALTDRLRSMLEELGDEVGD